MLHATRSSKDEANIQTTESPGAPILVQGEHNRNAIPKKSINAVFNHSHLRLTNTVLIRISNSEITSLLILSPPSSSSSPITVAAPAHPPHHHGPTKVSPNHPSAPKAACRPSTTSPPKEGRGCPVRQDHSRHLRAPTEDGRRSKAHLLARWEIRSGVGSR